MIMSSIRGSAYSLFGHQECEHFTAFCMLHNSLSVRAANFLVAMATAEEELSLWFLLAMTQQSVSSASRFASSASSRVMSADVALQILKQRIREVKPSCHRHTSQMTNQ